jgi:hypothetical protein
MKKLMLLLALVAATPVAYAQKAKAEEEGPTLPVSPDTHQVDYTGVVDVPGVTQAQLYSRAYEWIAKYYNSAQAVIQMQDKESGKLIAQGRTKAYFKGHEAGSITHTLSIYVKDGRYKYDITGFRHEYLYAGHDYSYGPFEQAEPTYIPGAFKGLAKRTWHDMKRTTDTDMKALVASLSAAMTTKAASDF